MLTFVELISEKLVNSNFECDFLDNSTLNDGILNAWFYEVSIRDKNGWENFIVCNET